MPTDRRLFLLTLGSASIASSLAACGGGMGAPRSSFDGGRAPDRDLNGLAFADWTDRQPEYLLYPGDEIEVATPTASELTRTVKVGPDGRIALPLIGSVMAAD
ncbi:polysaccharide biosynthesis/export family protein, partial [Salmonella sp. gx-h1]